MGIFIYMLHFLKVIVLLHLATEVAAQEGPGIVIAHPGQDVELLCTVTVTDLRSQEVAWLVNDNGPYRVDAIRDGELAGYTGVTDTASNNLIVENLMINDDRNGSNYRCVMIQAEDTLAFTEESDPTILYVAGVPAMVLSVTVDDNTININGNIVTLTLSWGEPFNNLDPIVNYTVSCSGDDTCPPNFITTDNTTRSYTITNLTPMTSYTFSVVASNSIGSGEAGVVTITTPDDDRNNDGVLIIVIIILFVAMMLLYCGSSSILFYNCCAKKEWYHLNENKYSKIINASIFVIGICTCGVSVLLWWLYEEITGCSQAKKSNFKDEPATLMSSNEIKQPKNVKFKEVPSVTNPLAEHHKVDKLTTTFDVPDSEYPADSFITDRHEDEKLPPGYVVIDIKNIMAYHKAIGGVQQGAVWNENTGACALHSEIDDKNKDRQATRVHHSSIQYDAGGIYALPNIKSEKSTRLYDLPSETVDSNTDHGKNQENTRLYDRLYDLPSERLDNNKDHEKDQGVKGVTGAQRSSFHYDATGIYTLPKDVFNINEDRKVMGVASTQSCSTLHQNTRAYDVPNVTADKDQRVIGVASTQSSSALHQITRAYDVPSVTADKDLMSARFYDSPSKRFDGIKDHVKNQRVIGLASTQSSSALHQNTRAYDVPNVTADKDQRVIGVASTQSCSTLHQNTGAYDVPNVTTNKDQGGARFYDLPSKRFDKSKGQGKNQRVIGVTSAQSCSALHQNTTAYDVPNVTTNKDQRAIGFASTQSSFALHQNTRGYDVPNVIAGKDQGAIGVASTQSSFALHYNTGAYDVPAVTADKDLTAIGLASTQSCSALHQNTRAYDVPNVTANKDQRVMGVTNYHNPQDYSARYQNTLQCTSHNGTAK